MVDDRGAVVESLNTYTVAGIIASRNEGRIGTGEMMRLLSTFRFSPELQHAFIDGLISVAEFTELVDVAKRRVMVEYQG